MWQLQSQIKEKVTLALCEVGKNWSLVRCQVDSVMTAHPSTGGHVAAHQGPSQRFKIQLRPSQLLPQDFLSLWEGGL
jgi:hypothetical protein